MNKELCIKVGKWNISILWCSVEKTSKSFIHQLLCKNGKLLKNAGFWKLTEIYRKTVKSTSAALLWYNGTCAYLAFFCQCKNQSLVSGIHTFFLQLWRNKDNCVSQGRIVLSLFIQKILDSAILNKQKKYNRRTYQNWINNDPQRAYAKHILHNRHEYGPIDKTMSLLKPISNTSLLTPYEQYYIYSFYKEGKLISEQSPSDPPPTRCSF